MYWFALKKENWTKAIGEIGFGLTEEGKIFWEREPVTCSICSKSLTLDNFAACRMTDDAPSCVCSDSCCQIVYLTEANLDTEGRIEEFVKMHVHLTKVERNDSIKTLCNQVVDPRKVKVTNFIEESTCPMCHLFYLSLDDAGRYIFHRGFGNELAKILHRNSGETLTNDTEQSTWNRAAYTCECGNTKTLDIMAGNPLPKLPCDKCPKTMILTEDSHGR